MQPRDYQQPDNQMSQAPAAHEAPPHDTLTEPHSNYSGGSGKHGRSGRKHASRKGLVVTIIILVVLLAAGGGYWFMKHRSAATPATSAKSTTPATTQTTPVAPQQSADSAPAGTTNYVSTQSDLNLSFNYPSDWTVSPKTTTAGATTPITVTSPSATVTTADGASVTGKVVVSIRPGGSQVSELAGATAAQDSAQIAYTHPTASQHQYPYLTFVHFAAGTKAAGSFEEVFVTGIQQLKKGDTINSDSLAGIDPLISASFYTCDTTACSNATGAGTLGITAATWQGSSLFQQVAALFASFKLN